MNFKPGQIVTAHIYPAPITARILWCEGDVAILDSRDEAGRPLTVYIDFLTLVPNQGEATLH